jgi:hypothetical protein
MLDPGFHIDNNSFIPVEKDFGKEILQQNIFRARATFTALSHGAHDQELNPPEFEGKFLGDIIDARVYLKELAKLLGIGSRPFLDQLALRGNGDEPRNLFGGDSERRS